MKRKSSSCRANLAAWLKGRRTSQPSAITFCATLNAELADGTLQ